MALRPFIVAELSANHRQDIEIAKKSILVAKQAGADAVKIQTYKPSCLTLQHTSDFFKIKGGLWNGSYLFDLYSEAMLPWEWHLELFDYAKAVGIEIFSSPFSLEALEFLESLKCPRYKIASFECIDFDFVSAVARKQKPIIISTGIATKDEIQEAIKRCKEVGNNDITLLQCTSAYPAEIREANLKVMMSFKNEFGVKVGLSDHTLGDFCALLATALGADMIEKHFILDKSLGGADCDFSMDQKEFKSMCQAINLAVEAIGNGKIREDESEVSKKRIFARSLWVIKPIKKGEVITPDHIASLRPYVGMQPKYLSQVIGKQATRNLDFGEPLQQEDIM